MVFTEQVDQCGPNDATSFMHLLARDSIEGLPPGGGISAKWVSGSMKKKLNEKKKLKQRENGA